MWAAGTRVLISECYILIRYYYFPEAEAQNFCAEHFKIRLWLLKQSIHNRFKVRHGWFVFASAIKWDVNLQKSVRDKLTEADVLAPLRCTVYELWHTVCKKVYTTFGL